MLLMNQWGKEVCIFARQESICVGGEEENVLNVLNNIGKEVIRNLVCVPSCLGICEP